MKRILSQFSPLGSRGFVLLFSLLIVGLLLAIGLSIFNIVFRELQLSGITRDSSTALYAADSGAECALYWEFRDAFQAATTTGTTIRCSSQNIAIARPTDSGGVTTWNFIVPVGNVGGPRESCALITIAKNNTTLRTTLESAGRNEGGASCTPGSRTVERTLEYSF
jgi:hypothetical protein